MNKTIPKILLFVIFASGLGLFLAGCSAVSSRGTNNNRSSDKISKDYARPQVVGTITAKEIKESSGIAASPCQPDVLWTHNDSGDGAFIYALNKKGESLGTFSVSNAENVDWEDIAAVRDKQGACFLYIGDIGNNTRERDVFTIYRLKEPQVSAAGKDSGRKDPQLTEPAGAIRFEYPDLRRDAETLMVHPATGDIYILSKRLSDSSGVYKLAAGYSFDKPNKLEKIADLTVPAIPNGLLTGGDIAPDGRRVIVCDYFSGYELILPEKAKNFDEIWKQKPQIVELGEREQGEAVGYAADGNSIFATSEKKNSPLIEARKK